MFNLPSLSSPTNYYTFQQQQPHNTQLRYNQHKPNNNHNNLQQQKTTQYGFWDV